MSAMGDFGSILVHEVNASHSYTYVNVTSTSLASNLSTTLPYDVNVTDAVAGPPPSIHAWYIQAIISTVLGLLILGTIVGNSLVCTAVALAKRLQSPYNLLIVSLAVSDGLVAVLVMPLAVVYEVLGYFPFSNLVCNLWTSLDVILCSASILNLCMISIDRYFCITKPFEYAPKRTPRRMAIMIAAVWCLSVIISVPPLFGYKAKPVPFQCMISQEIGYQIYATLGSFYFPLIVMIIIYFRIWKISSRLVKTHKYSIGSRGNGSECAGSSITSSEVPLFKNGALKNGINNNESIAEMGPVETTRALSKRRFTLRLRSSNESAKQNKGSGNDRRAIKTLGIIMGGFTLCWLPFFIVAVMRPFLDPDAIPIWLSSCLVWLGYTNSFLNPLIYVRFNREFRTPFKLILLCRCHGINRRLRSESYVEQYGPDHIYRDRDRDSMRVQHRQIVRYNSKDQVNVQVVRCNSNDQVNDQVVQCNSKDQVNNHVVRCNSIDQVNVQDVRCNNKDKVNVQVENGHSISNNIRESIV